VIAGLVLLGGGAAAGAFGSLLGLGGGILIVPLLTLGIGVPLREAVAASPVSVIVTSSASAAVYLQRHVANLRLGMTLELFSAVGALVGGLVAFLIDERFLAGLFAVLLIWVAASMARRKDPPGAPVTASPLPGGVAAVAAPDDLEPAPQETATLAPEAVETHVIDAAPDAALDGSFTASLSGPGYRVHRLPAGMLGSVFAGVNSALLGVGGGIIKVPVMHLVMRGPLRTSTATSNMMMGITATSSAVIYLLRDEIDPFIAGPIALGVFVGASVGSRMAHRVDVRILRWLFVVVLSYTAVQMAIRALGL
jgi:uncharacterized membrane protein YfcA